MYVNKCIKCGREFETKNPKRVICPDCLYPDKSMMINPSSPDGTGAAAGEQNKQLQSYSTPDEAPRYYSAGGNPENAQRYNRPQQRPRSGYSAGGGYNRDNRGGYARPSYNRDNRRQGGYQKSGGYNRDNRGGFSPRRPGHKFNNKRPAKTKAPKQLLVTKEQMEQIEVLYKAMLPLPNPDCHEVIGEKLGIEPRKVFFGINLVRQKLMLPKLPFPKRKLAISPDQIFAIKNLYEPLLPLPPIGCHKIIAAQLKMDEWRVHVGIGLIRAQMGLKRWNQDRPDAPEEYRKQQRKPKNKKANEEVEVTQTAETQAAAEGQPETAVAEVVEAEKPKKSKKTKNAEETSEV